MGLEFHAGNGTLRLIGKYIPEMDFIRQTAQAIDYGLDFYAPQVLEALNGRRIMIAQMQNRDKVIAKPYNCRWYEQMPLPLELSLKEGRLIQNPVRKLEAYRRAQAIHQNIPPLPPGSGYPQTEPHPQRTAPRYCPHPLLPSVLLGEEDQA